MSMVESQLPSGEVTFVFTDIEGSTRLLRALGDDYESVLRLHRQILRQVWDVYDGHELGTEGDSFLVAFADAGAAIAACVSAQLELAGQVWPGDERVRVRMGVHSGLAHPRDGEYVALALHQAARVASAAHGGQVLVSEDATAHLRDPSRSGLSSLGRFRLRDFDAPAELFAADLPGGRALRPPRLVPADGHNLAAPPSELVAREGELAAVTDLLAPGRVVTITGPGGVGKTRLAIELGLRVAADWHDGAWLVGLDSLADETVIPSAISEALGLPVGRGGDQWEEVLGHLGDMSLLLILDSCEHLFPGCTRRVADLLSRCPSLAVVATSREPLGLFGEELLRLAPLATTAEEGGPAAAVQLFLASAPAGAQLDGATSATEVLELCAELDGLPLAIELAASRVDVLSPRDILQAVRSQTHLLSTRDPRVPLRQQTLERTLDWSYGLLSSAEQAGLRRLSLLASSFDLDTAAAAVSDDTVLGADVPDLVWSLVSKSLINAERTAGASRYRLLRTVRSYASQQLEPQERSRASAQLVDHFLARHGPDLVLDQRWVGDVGLELDNLRSLVHESTEVSVQSRQKLAWTIGRYHDVADRFAAGTEEVRTLLEVLTAETAERVALLTLFADLHLRVGDTEGARGPARAAQELAEKVGTVSWDDAGVMRTAGEIAMRDGRFEEAIRLAEDVAVSTEVSTRGQARMLDLLGLARLLDADLDGATEAFRQEVAAWESLRLDSFAATAHSNLAETYLRRDLTREAAAHQLASLDLASALGQPVLIAFAMVMAAQLSGRDGHWLDAVKLQAAADQVLQRAGYALYDSDIELRQDLLRRALEHATEASVADAQIDGRRMPLSESSEAARVALVRMSEGG
jgi:predicted ATPase/class 3 adenylate cyclase